MIEQPNNLAEIDEKSADCYNFNWNRVLISIFSILKTLDPFFNWFLLNEGFGEEQKWFKFKLYKKNSIIWLCNVLLINLLQ